MWNSQSKRRVTDLMAQGNLLQSIQLKNPYASFRRSLTFSITRIAWENLEYNYQFILMFNLKRATTDDLRPSIPDQIC